MATSRPKVLIVGAGSVGMVTGYHLALAGAAVTYLVRPGRADRISRPQTLYCYDDHSLRTFSDFEVVADAAGLEGRSFDFLFVTLDSAALRAPAGLDLLDSLGKLFRDTDTGVVLGSRGLGVRDWFVQRSGLADEQVTSGVIANFAHEGKAELPLHEGTKPDLLAQADFAYRDFSPAGFVVDTSSPKVAQAFAELYDKNGENISDVVSTDDYEIPVSGTALVAALEQLGWPDMRDVDPDNETWQLATAAMAEIQRLPIFGPAGVASSEKLDARTSHGTLLEFAETLKPLDFIGFTRYHHGGKLQQQTRRTLRDALERGKAADQDMPALQELVKRISDV